MGLDDEKRTQLHPSEYVFRCLLKAIFLGHSIILQIPHLRTMGIGWSPKIPRKLHIHPKLRWVPGSPVFRFLKFEFLVLHVPLGSGCSLSAEKM